MLILTFLPVLMRKYNMENGHRTPAICFFLTCILLFGHAGMTKDSPDLIVSGDAGGGGNRNILDISHKISYLHKDSPPSVC